MGFLVAFYMARKNPRFCKKIEQCERLYYIFIETLIFIKERMPLIIDIIGVSIFPPLNCNLFFQVITTLGNFKI